MSFRRYEEYKDSGVEWLGEVPAHWSVKAIKWLSPVLRGASPRPIDDPKYFDDDGEYAWVRIADVSASDGKLLETPQKLSALGSSLSVRLEPGSLFVSIAGTVGRPCITGVKACIHDGFVFFPKLALDCRLLYRIFEAGICYGGLGKMGTQLNLNTDTIGSIRVAVAPDDELGDLLDSLDRETAKIDALVAEQQNLIALLKEKRQALISHAVTKGLDPAAPMKDSGVAWLGEVPEQWGRGTKLLDIAADDRHSFVNGPFGSDLLTSELVREGVPVVYIRDITSQGYARVSDWCVTPKKAGELNFCSVTPGDVIIAKVGNPPGLATVYPIDEPVGIVTQDVIRLRLNREKGDPAYVTWLLNSRYGQTSIDGISVESTRTRVGLGDYKQLRFFMPPLAEQIEIAAFLKLETAKIDDLVSEAENAIALLQERRTALISAAVTGKIDVRASVSASETLEAEAA